jgi:predicted amidophosphoribosyltransferase
MRSRPQTRRSFQIRLTAVLWRFLEEHEPCMATAVGVDGFDLVTTVPSRDQRRDEAHPLRTMVGAWCRHTAPRHRRMLYRTDEPATQHVFTTARYAVTQPLDGQNVLLIEDTWTKGANAQSAAYALRRAGARVVALAVIGRHINRDHGDNAERLDALDREFDWDRCWRHTGNADEQRRQHPRP